MSKSLKKFSFDGSFSTEDVEINFVPKKSNDLLVHRCVVAIMHNMRQWSANTQGRSEVNHSKQKPHAQKGTGRARQGFLGSPQYKGGGVVFGPKPKFGVKKSINKKQKRIAVNLVLSDKVQHDRVVVLGDPVIGSPSTKSVVTFLKMASISGRVLFVFEDGCSNKYDNFKKSTQNMRNVSFCLCKDINAHLLIMSDWVVVCESAYSQFVSFLGGE